MIAKCSDCEGLEEDVKKVLVTRNSAARTKRWKSPWLRWEYLGNLVMGGRRRDKGRVEGVLEM